MFEVLQVNQSCYTVLILLLLVILLLILVVILILILIVIPMFLLIVKFYSFCGYVSMPCCEAN